MNKNKEQIKNEEITENVDVVFRDPTEDEMIELKPITLSAAYELLTVVESSILMFEEQDMAMETDLYPLFRNLRKELF